jgi:cytochrome c553
MREVCARLRAATLLALLAAGTQAAFGAAVAEPAVTEALRERLRICSTCHGEDGNSRTAGVPSISGQPKTFIENQLVLFREGFRDVPGKQAAVAGLSDREIPTIAAVFAASPVRTVPGPANQALAQQGRALIQQLGCETCHLPDLRGRAQIPRLASQREEYLVEAMTALRDYRRPSGDTIMAVSLSGVSDADIKALAHYLAHR